MSKCHTVQNPCKICLRSVSNKTGLKCQGACGTWVHFSCLNYTAGKIKEIKAGIIKVTCPCPDCKTSKPKEFRTDQSYSYTNQQCRAKNCSVNKGSTVSPCPPSCPLCKYGTNCKQHSVPQLPNIGQPCVTALASDACLVPIICLSSSISTPNIASDYGRGFPSQKNCGSPQGSKKHLVKQLYNTVGQLTRQINDLMSKMKQLLINEKGSGKECAHPRGGGGGCHPPKCDQPRSKPKPCFCPNNRVRSDTC